MFSHLIVIYLCTIFHFSSPSSLSRDTFTEELLLKPLFSEQLYAHFQFSTVWNIDPSNEQCKYLKIVVIFEFHSFLFFIWLGVSLPVFTTQ